jgi:hypothetical protein
MRIHILPTHRLVHTLDIVPADPREVRLAKIGV